MAIEFIDPRAQPGAPVDPYQLRLDCPDDGAGITIGLLANGFPDSVNFLDEVGRALRESLPEVSIKSYNKGNASMVAGDQLLDGITKECSAVVAAYGH